MTARGRGNVACGRTRRVGAGRAEGWRAATARMAAVAARWSADEAAEAGEPTGGGRGPMGEGEECAARSERAGREEDALPEVWGAAAVVFGRVGGGRGRGADLVG